MTVNKESEIIKLILKRTRTAMMMVYGVISTTTIIKTVEDLTEKKDIGEMAKHLRHIAEDGNVSKITFSNNDLILAKHSADISIAAMEILDTLNLEEYIDIFELGDKIVAFAEKIAELSDYVDDVANFKLTKATLEMLAVMTLIAELVKEVTEQINNKGDK